MVQRVSTTATARHIVVIVLAVLSAGTARAQFAWGISTSNGPDNNPNQSPTPARDVLGENGFYVQDSLRVGPGTLLPSYTFGYNSYVHLPKDNFFAHAIGLSWFHETLFMPASVRAAAARAAADTVEEEEISDTVKDALAERLRTIATAVEDGGFAVNDSVTNLKTPASTVRPANDTTHPAVGAASDSTDADDDESDDEGDEDSTATTANSPHSSDSMSRAAQAPRSDITAAAANVTEDAALQTLFSKRFEAIADSIDDADGSEALKTWVEHAVMSTVRAFVDSFPGDSIASIVRDSCARFIAALRQYRPPTIDTVVVEIEDSTIYAPLSLPRTSLFDWTQSDLTIETTEDDTASYALELTSEYDLRKEPGNNDSLGEHSFGFTATAHQAAGRTFNIFESASATLTDYAVLDTLNNTVYNGVVQARWQPAYTFTGLFEAGLGLKRYSSQQIDTQNVRVGGQPRKLIVKSATATSQAFLGGGAFWRVFRPTSLGITGFWLHNPSDKARISANTYLVRQHGATDLSDDRFTYSGFETRLYIKQAVFGDAEIGLTIASQKKNYNQYTFKDVVRKLRKITIDQLVRTNTLRSDNYRTGELQLTKTFEFEHAVFSQLSLELLLGYIDNGSNDPNFVFHETYTTLGVNLDF